MWVSEEQFEQSEIASLQRSIHELELHIRRPKERTGWPDLRCLFSENHIYSTLPQYAGETDTQPIDLVLTSTAREISETSEEIRYTIEYSDKAATGDSFAKFSFGDATVDRAPHLEGVFTLSEKPQQIEIVDVMPPQNLFASINFLDQDGNVIGSAPVFLEVPAE